MKCLVKKSNNKTPLEVKVVKDIDKLKQKIFKLCFNIVIILKFILLQCRFENPYPREIMTPKREGLSYILLLR